VLGLEERTLLDDERVVLRDGDTELPEDRTEEDLEGDVLVDDGLVVLEGLDVLLELPLE